MSNANAVQGTDRETSQSWAATSTVTVSTIKMKTKQPANVIPNGLMFPFFKRQERKPGCIANELHHTVRSSIVMR